MKTCDHILKEFRGALESSDEERMRLAERPMWVRYPAAKSILDTLQWLLQVPKRPRMPNLLITGESNNGKTTIIEKFREEFGQGYINDDSEPVKPLIVAEAPPVADEKSLYISILERFHPPYRRTAPAKELRYETIHLFRACRTRMLIIDEFHSMLAGTALKQREVMNAIKLLCNETRIPIIGVGTHEAQTILNHDPQYKSRFRVEELPLWECDKQFQLLLIAFERMLPLKKPSNLRQEEFRKLLHEKSKGNIGNLHRILIECTKAAITSGDEQIHQALIKSVLKKNRWLQPRGTREQKA